MSLKKELSNRTDVVNLAAKPIILRNVKPGTKSGDAVAYEQAVIDTGAQTVAGLKTFADGIATDTVVEETAAAGVTVDSALIKDGAFGKRVAATATADGLTTGLLTGSDQFVTVTSASVNNIISLPLASATPIGTFIRGMVGANGFELRVAVADATTVKINDVTTNVEAAIPTDVSFTVELISATEWILRTRTALGEEGTAIVPDAV